MSKPRRPTTPKVGGRATYLSRPRIFALLTLVILVLKLYLIFQPAVEDMVTYEKWGTWVGEHGLGEVYFGVYFPVQYQLFGLTWSIAQELSAEFVIACKAVNLLFDLGNLALSILLLRRYGRSLWYALLYWAHPWFVTVFSLGYVDFQFAFFLLLALYLATAMKEKDHPLRYHLLVGIPIAVAFLMKPQAQGIIIALAVYALAQLASRHTARYFVTLVPAVLFYIGYSIYFALAGAPLVHLTKTYLSVGNVMPCLTAHMLNVWYPLAYSLKDPEKPIYSVSDAISIPPLQVPARTIAVIVTLALVAVFACWQAFRREKEVEYGRDLGVILAFVTMVVPFTMTSAHENHFFLGAIFLLLYSARSGDRWVLIVWHAIVFLQFLNIFILYETGGMAVSLRDHYSELFRSILAVVDSLLFLYLLYAMAAHRRRDGSSWNLARRQTKAAPGR